MRLAEFKDSKYHYFKDDQGRLQGEYKSWGEDGQLVVHCYYVKDELSGEFKKWFSGGQIRTHCHFLEGNIDGDYSEWYECGELAEHSFYIKGKNYTHLHPNQGLYSPRKHQ